MNGSTGAFSLPLEASRLKQGAGSLFGYVVALLGSMAIATALGAVAIPLDTTTHLLVKGILHLPFEEHERAQAAIVYLIRFPRVLSAAVVGACLAVSGVLMQGLFRNSLADAGLIGVSSGGALGGVLAISTGLASVSTFALPCATLTGAVLTAFAVYFFATRKERTQLTTLLLVGIAVNAALASMTSLILSLAPDYEISRQMLFWLMGGLEGRGWTHLQVMLPFAVSGLLPALCFSRDLNALLLGEEVAQSLGIQVEWMKRLLLMFAAFMAGAAVAMGGTIGFVGLVIPHVTRLLVGPHHRLLLPSALLGGAIFLVWCDLLARTLAPAEELRLGIITACVGAPMFLHLLLRQERQQRGSV